MLRKEKLPLHSRGEGRDRVSIAGSDVLPGAELNSSVEDSLWTWIIPREE